MVTKFILPALSDLNFFPIDHGAECKYVSEDHNTIEYVFNLKIYCKKIVPFVHNSKEQISSYNHTAHDILMNEISLRLLNFPKVRVEKRSIIGSLISGFIGLACEGISSFLHYKDTKLYIKQ